MTSSRKYAALPDLDSAQDIYETPDLTDGVSTLRTSTSPTSPSHRHSGSSDGSEDSDAGVSRSRLQPSQARRRFSPANVDARGVDFSDRVSSKRKSYKTSNRRRRKDEDVSKLGDLSDEEDGESLERKVARLRREIEEVREEVGKRKALQKRASGQPRNRDTVDEKAVESLSEIIDGLHTGVHGSTQSAPAALIKELSTQISTERTSSGANGADNPINITYTPSFTNSHALAKAAAFDTRLAMLEKLIGLSSTPAETPPPILPTLTTLLSQVNALTNASPSSLETQGRRVRQLTNEAEKLVEMRRAAQTALEEARNRKRDLEVELLGNEDQGPLAGAARDLEKDTAFEQELKTKVNALFAALATVERLEPVLPPLLERLRSLRKIHGEAVITAEGLDGVEKRQLQMDQEIEKWSAGLDKVEAAVKESESVLKGNTEVVEGWIKGLEERMQRLGA